MKNILNFKMFETKSKDKKWSKNDTILVLYYYKFGLRKLAIDDDDFANSYLGTLKQRLKLQSLNIMYLLSNGETGYEHVSKTQEQVVEEYGKYEEEELRKVVLDIMDKTDVQENLKLVSLIKLDKEEREKKKKATKKKIDIDKEISKKYGKNLKRVDDLETFDIPFEVGDEITHKAFGSGIIVDIIDDKKLNIIFDNGKKGIYLYNPNIIK